MLNEQKIIFVSIVDNNNETVPNLGFRIWHAEEMIKGFLKDKTCLIGRKTFDITHWKGSNSWVITRNKKWSKVGIGTIHSLEDLHLFAEGPIYVLGGSSLHEQLKDHVDEIHLYVINDSTGRDPWIDLNMKEWKPLDYLDRKVWSYVHLEKTKKRRPRRKPKEDC